MSATRSARFWRDCGTDGRGSRTASPTRAVEVEMVRHGRWGGFRQEGTCKPLMTPRFDLTLTGIMLLIVSLELPCEGQHAEHIEITAREAGSAHRQPPGWGQSDARCPCRFAVAGHDRARAPEEAGPARMLQVRRQGKPGYAVFAALTAMLRAGPSPRNRGPVTRRTELNHSLRFVKRRASRPALARSDPSVFRLIDTVPTVLGKNNRRHVADIVALRIGDNLCVSTGPMTTIVTGGQ